MTFSPSQSVSHAALQTRRLPTSSLSQPDFSPGVSDGGKLGNLVRNATGFVRRGHGVPNADPSSEKQQIARDALLVDNKCKERFTRNGDFAFFAHAGGNATITKQANGTFRITGRVDTSPRSSSFDLILHDGKVSSANIQNTARRASDTAIQSLLVDANYALSNPHLMNSTRFPGTRYA